MRPTRPWWLSLAVILCVALAAGPALAQSQSQAQGLAGVGATSPANGFPTWYQDKTGVTLEQCLVTPLGGDPNVADPCGLAGTLPGGDHSVIVFPDNFPDEFFYWNTSADLDTNGGANRATLVLALEGAFGADGDGSQIVFARFRFRVNGGLVPGAAYTVTHPYGVARFVASSTGTINFTDDFGCGAVPPACDFTSVLPTTNVGPFLLWDPAVPPAAPVGYVGDPNVAHPIVGSPFGTNFLGVEGPNVGGPGVDVVTTNLFSVMGRLFRGVGTTALTIDRTSYLRNANTTEVNVFVHSSGNATVIASGNGIPTTQLTADPQTGRFFARILLPGNATLPDFVRITATAPNSDPTIRDNPLVDEVTVAAATFDVTTGTLTINASSSDQFAQPTLTAEGGATEPLGTFANGTLVVSMTVPPGVVTVKSSEGGSTSAALALTVQ